MYSGLFKYSSIARARSPAVYKVCVWNDLNAQYIYPCFFIRIMYDDEFYGARIVARSIEASDEAPDTCDHMIAMQTRYLTIHLLLHQLTS